MYDCLFLSNEIFWPFVGIHIDMRQTFLLRHHLWSRLYSKNRNLSWISSNNLWAWCLSILKLYEVDYCWQLITRIFLYLFFEKTLKWVCRNCKESQKPKPRIQIKSRIICEKKKRTKTKITIKMQWKWTCRKCDCRGVTLVCWVSLSCKTPTWNP